jgi:hypothetical protein
MSYRHAESDTAESVYKDQVRRRLFRSASGLSMTGCVGILIVLVLAVLALKVPAIEHAEGTFHSGPAQPELATKGLR